MTHEYILTRTDFTKKSTIGSLTLHGEPVCYVLEDRVRNAGEPKVYGETAIGYGRYQLVITKSARFSKAAGKDVFLPLLVDVPLFQGVRVHVGNFSTESEGCLLVGTGKTADMVTNSKVAFKKFFEQMRGFLDAGDECWITVKK